MLKSCPTCERRNHKRPGECQALHPPTPSTEDCWAWTDDPHWARQAAAAYSAYKKLLKERGLRG